MKGLNSEWILIGAYLIGHILFLFLDSGTLVFLGISAGAYLVLAFMYSGIARSWPYTIAFVLSSATYWGVFLRVLQINESGLMLITGTAGLVLMGLLVAKTAWKNRLRLNSPVFLPLLILVSILAQIALVLVQELAIYAPYLNYPIFLFSGQLLLSRVSQGQELKGFYAALKLILLISGTSILDQTISVL